MIQKSDKGFSVPCPYIKAGIDWKNGGRAYVECEMNGPKTWFPCEDCTAELPRRAEEPADKDFIDSRFDSLTTIMLSETGAIRNGLIALIFGVIALAVLSFMAWKAVL